LTGREWLGHNYVGPEHVLVALAADQSAAGRALRGLGLDAEVLRAELIRLVEAGVLPGRYRDDAELLDAQNPVKVPRCFKLPRARRTRTRRGWPQPDRPSPIPAMLRSRGTTADALRQAILAQLAATI
jgi:hypothetical protein